MSRQTPAGSAPATEGTDPRYADLELWPTERAVATMLEGQIAAVAALRTQVAALARAAEAAAIRLRGGGRLVYAGAGTSARVAVQDGVELVPTYGWPPERLAYLIAGGPEALVRSIEGAEDDAEAARGAVAGARVGAGDVLVGVSASGRTPYTLAAVQAARAAGALTVAIADDAGAPLLGAAEWPLLADSGREPVAGSTRMQAGTAQKAALTLFSTAVMLRDGRVCRGRMVDMRIANAKLRARAQAMVGDLAGVDARRAAQALAATGQAVKPAVLVACGLSPEEAGALLRRYDGDLRRALEALGNAAGAAHPGAAGEA